jgi:hypothetical protein
LLSAGTIFKLQQFAELLSQKIAAHHAPLDAA